MEAQVLISARSFDAELSFFCDRLGFRIDTISPADAPSVAVVSGHGLTARIDRQAHAAPAHLRLLTDDADVVGTSEVSPNGTTIEWVVVDPPLHLPPPHPSFVVSRMADDASWGTGRAGMQYRDLIPDRQGGRFIASHIRIPGAGPVPDWVHYHHIRFQLIYCYRGAARLAYEDQGEPFRFEAGDCVLQPPRIRHRVLESFDDLEVIEIGCPALHDTHADHDMDLPTGRTLPDRDYGGQRFVHHRAAEAHWSPWRFEGFECRDTGIGTATDGLGGVRVVRPTTASDTTPRPHNGELLFWFVLEGAASVVVGEREAVDLHTGDSVVIPAGEPYAIAGAASDLELLEVSLPDALD